MEKADERITLQIVRNLEKEDHAQKFNEDINAKEEIAENDKKAGDGDILVDEVNIQQPIVETPDEMEVDSTFSLAEQIYQCSHQDPVIQAWVREINVRNQKIVEGTKQGRDVKRNRGLERAGAADSGRVPLGSGDGGNQGFEPVGAADGDRTTHVKMRGRVGRLRQ